MLACDECHRPEAISHKPLDINEGSGFGLREDFRRCKRGGAGTQHSRAGLRFCAPLAPLDLGGISGSCNLR